MRLVRRFARRLAWFAATTFAAAALAPAAAPADSAGPVWSIHRPGGGTVYLAGSVHVLDAARSRLPPRSRRLIAMPSVS